MSIEKLLIYALFAIIGVGVLWAVTRNLEHDSEGDSGHDRDPHE